MRRLCLPISALNLLHYVKSMVTVLCLGRLGRAELAGGALAVGLTNVTGYSVLSGLALGLEPLAGQAFGSRTGRTRSRPRARCAEPCCSSSPRRSPSPRSGRAGPAAPRAPGRRRGARRGSYCRYAIRTSPPPASSSPRRLPPQQGRDAEARVVRGARRGARPRAGHRVPRCAAARARRRHGRVHDQLRHAGVPVDLADVGPGPERAR